MAEPFNGAAEPMRAIRDLIVACETVFGGDDEYEQGYLNRARDGFTALRKLFDDSRPAEEIAEAEMIEPRIANVPALINALQMTSGALRLFERMACVEAPAERVITFTGDFAHLGKLTLPDILDHANMALEGA